LIKNGVLLGGNREKAVDVLEVDNRRNIAEGRNSSGESSWNGS
jgi:hypothetical protein